MARRIGRGVWGRLRIALFVLTAALAGLAALAAGGAADFGSGIGWAEGLLLLCAGGAAASLWAAFLCLDEHANALDRLRGALIMAAAGRFPPPPLEAESEAGMLHAALVELETRRRERGQKPDARLAAALAAVREPVAVVTASGQVSLVNGAAKRLLGADRVAVGTSVFRALERKAATALMTEAQATGRAVSGTIRDVEGDAYPVDMMAFDDGTGLVITFHLDAFDRIEDAELEHDLRLHDNPPPPPALTDDLPLSELPALVLDTETTGLDVETDRVVAIGAVRLHGAGLFPAHSMDLLVNPGIAIPAKAAAVHGITDAMAAGAPSFAAIHAELETMLAGVVLVGHNIGFDIGVLRRESERAALPWTDPPSLDTVLLAAVLFPDMKDLNLGTLAQRMGVDVRGRHTALGDALVTAEVFVRMIPMLAEAGAETYGAARRFMKKPRRLRALQTQAGW